MTVSRLALLALAALGAVRWGSLLAAPPYLRLLAPVLIGVGIVVASAGRPRSVRWPIALAGLLLVLPLAGVPGGWLTALRVARISQLIGDGVGAIPGALVPLLGGGPLRVVTILGAGWLVIGSAVLLARAREETPAGRALAATPLLVLSAVPDTLVAPRSPSLEGAVVLVLLVAVVWGPRLRRPAALVVVALSAAGAAALAPAVRPDRPWIDVRRLAGSIGGSGGEQFDFRQRFGPLAWSRHNRVLFTVTSLRPAYWKAVDLDTFDGRGFAPAAQPGALLPVPSPAALRAGMLTLIVHDLALRSPQLISAGYTLRAAGIPGRVGAGAAPGTFTVTPPLAPGARYVLSAYAPQPTAGELSASVGDGDPAALAPDRTIALPAGPAIRFPGFHADAAGAAYALATSPYARAFALARSLARAAPTPYAFVRSVMAHLSRGFTYDERPPAADLPLLDFLFGSHRGYCQQFAGAMALLLRMGGVPARVVGGFAPGTPDAARGRWIVTDSAAHDWVEAWFGQWGWVTFDPTPPADPAIAGSISIPGVAFSSAHSAVSEHRRPARPAPRRRSAAAHPAPVARAGSPGTHRAGERSLPPLAAAGLLALLAAGGLVLLGRARPGAQTADALVTELERAMRRSGRPLSPGQTLAELERRFAGHDGAVRYLHALRDTRYAARATPPTPADRRALRGALAQGLGPGGRLRAWYALPPRRPAHRPERHGACLH